MLAAVQNSVPTMWEQRGKTFDRYGQDQTGKVTYRFNNRGFRSNQDFDFVPVYAFFGSSLVAGIGVPIEDTFASQFDCSHNYGVCGQYCNYHIYQNLQSFLSMSWYNDQIKIAVFWTDRDDDVLGRYYQQLKNPNIWHFFCGDALPYDRCYRIITNLDSDVSGTHMGPKTHMVLSKILCNLFNQ